MIVRAPPGAIGIDLGGTNLKLALLDGENRIIKRLTVPTGGVEGHDAVIARMVDGITAMQGQAPDVPVAAVGIGVPGMVDMATGVTGDLPNLPGRWSGVPVGPTIADACGLSAALINDAKAFAVAEHRLGAARGVETALLVTVGTGIGGAVVAQGKVLFGVGGAAGEIGHLIVQPQGARCTCGNWGCVETLASGPAIVGEAVRRIAQGYATSMNHLCSGDLDAVTPELVARAAEMGDQVAGEIIDRAAEWLGIAIAGGIALLAPEVVVIGGGVAPSGSRFFVVAKAAARARCGVTEIDRIAFRPASLGYDSGVIGAAIWGRDAAATPVTTTQS